MSWLVSISFSGVQVEHDSFIEDILSALRNHDLAGSVLESEITENVIMNDTLSTVQKLTELEKRAELIYAVLLLHLCGFLLGYVLSRLFQFSERDAQTVSIEVGMQNSGLATELARNNFSSYGLATVPGAISALTHCILGSITAGLCRWRNASAKK